MGTVRSARQRLLLCQIVSMALLFASCSKEEIPSFTIGSGSVTGNYLVAGRAIARIVNENQATNTFRLESTTSTGSVSNINAIAAGENQFGIAQADHQYQAVRGSGEWKDKGPQENLRAVFSMYTESVTLVVGGDSDIQSINDLKGKLVDIGASGSGTQGNAIDALGAAGINWKNDIRAREESTDERLSKFMRGELDAFFFTVSHPNMEIKFTTFSVRGARLIPISNIDNLVSDNPYYFRTLISSNLYPMAGNDADVETIGVNATLLTSASVPDDVVYALTRTVFENLDSFAESKADFASLLDGEFLEGLTAPIHPGAMKYYREIGLDAPSL